MAVRKKFIRTVVEKLLSDHHIRSPSVNVEQIVRDLGIQVQKDSVVDSLSGYLVRKTDTGKALIGVNSDHPPARQRFTIAHELAHYLLHEGEVVHYDGDRRGFAVNLRSEGSSESKKDLEREANLFAAELLMPARFLESDPRIQRIDLLDDKNKVLKEVARDYQVSKEALTYRLANLQLIDPL